MDNKNSSKNSGLGIVGIVFIVLIILYFIGSSSDSKSKYEEDFDSGIEKYYSGEDMTESEYNAVKDYNEWKDKNTDKSYSEWDN